MLIVAEKGQGMGQVFTKVSSLLGKLGSDSEDEQPSEKLYVSEIASHKCSLHRQM